MFDLLVFFLSEFLEPYPLCIPVVFIIRSYFSFQFNVQREKSFFLLDFFAHQFVMMIEKFIFFVDFQSRFSYQGFFPLGYSLMVVTKLTATMLMFLAIFFLFTSLEQYAHQILIYSESFYFIWWLKFKIVHRLCVCGESFFWFISVFFFCHRFSKWLFFLVHNINWYILIQFVALKKNDFFFPGWI